MGMTVPTLPLIGPQGTVMPKERGSSCSFLAKCQTVCEQATKRRGSFLANIEVAADAMFLTSTFPFQGLGRFSILIGRRAEVQM